MKLEDIRSIELEITTKCNARCPQCVRNYYGSTTWESLPIMDMSFDDFVNSMPDIWKTLTNIKFCGTYGDPLMHKDLIKFINYIKKKNHEIVISIHTNGGIRSQDWWRELAETLGDQDTVFFGIDGLEDTNHLYRIDVNYKKVIDNLTAFNSAGGRSVWSYLVFEHNEHQVEEARELSKKLGCLDFSVKSTSRFINKRHEPIDQSPVMNLDHEIIYWIKPTKGKYRNDAYDDMKAVIEKYGSWENYLRDTEIDCLALSGRVVTIAANGEIFPCGWLADRMFGYEPESHRDHETMLTMMEGLGGRHKINFLETPLKEIVEDGWFEKIKESWSNNSIERCANQCGELNKIIKSANRNNQSGMEWLTTQS